MSSWEVDVRAWFPSQTEAYIGGRLADKKKGDGKVQLIFELDDGSKQTVEASEESLNDARNASLPPLANPPMFEASEDLTNLSHLNEPAVLQAIKLRYAQKEIYTYSGIVLIATNPFARVDSLYVPGMVQVYAGKQRSSQAPHLFAIAEESFA